MIDPYRMVVVNVLGLVILSAGVLFYKFIYPKKKINLFLLLILISFLPIVSVFRIGAYESGDFNIHVRRAIEFFNLLKEGNLMPTWAGDLNGTYGYPLFGFNYTLPYYFISLIHLFGLSFISSLKTFLALNFILSGIFMYLFSRTLFKNSLASFSTSIFYLFNPYHLIAIHFRVPVGEVLSYTLAPLVFYFINKFIHENKITYLLLAGLMLGLVALSHILIGIFLVPVILVYFLVNFKLSFRTFIYFFCLMGTGILVSTYQWIAPIIYKPYLFTTAYQSDPLKLLYFPSLSELIYSPWRFGLLFQGPKGELSFLLGYAQVIVILLIIFSVLKNNLIPKYKNLLIFCSVGFILTLFLISPYSKFVWTYFPPINGPISQRLLLIASIYTSLFMGYLVLIFKKQVAIIYLLLIIAIVSTILNWGQRRVIPEINDSYLTKDLPFGTKWADEHFYANSRWVDPKNPWFSSIPKRHLEILKGDGVIKDLSRTSTKHEYSISAYTDIQIVENTLYFPGWTAIDNGKSINIAPDKKGKILLSLSKGKHHLIINFADLYSFYLSKLISIITIILIITYAIYDKRKVVTSWNSKV